MPADPSPPARFTLPAEAVLRAREKLVLDHFRDEVLQDWDATLSTFPHPHYELIAQMLVHDGDSAVRGYYHDTRVAFPDQDHELIAKDGPPAPEIDLVNSPGLLRSTDLGGRTVVQKTAAGTVGALAVREASLVLCAGFVVAEATARLLRTRACDSVTFLVTGEDGRADKDLACAQYIARRAAGAGTDAAGFVRRAARSRAAAELASGVRQGVHPDVALCLELDRFPFALVAAPGGLAHNPPAVRRAPADRRGSELSTGQVPGSVPTAAARGFGPRPEAACRSRARRPLPRTADTLRGLRPRPVGRIDRRARRSLSNVAQTLQLRTRLMAV